jgi:uncharacterized protein with FMN-binding domain
MNAIPKRGVVATALTAGALVLILSFKTPNTSSLAAGSGNGGNGGNGGNRSGSSSQQGPGSGRSTFSGQLTGSTVQTPFGAVQVQVTLQNGQITDVQALQMPGDQRRSQQISQYAAPQLHSEVLQAQGAQVDTISGATYTSEGYVQSLQSALDQAGA